MAAFTSKADGNSSSAGQTTWNEVGVPGNGDTVTISHAVTVDVDTVWGTSPAAGAVVVTVAAPGSLTVAPGKTLTVRGDLQLQNTTLTMGAGSKYRFDSTAAGAPSTTNYRIVMGSASSQQNTKVISNGTAGARVTFDKVSGGANGRFERFSSAVSAWNQMRATFTDFYDLGAAAYSFGSYALDFSLSQSAAAEAYIEDCSFIRCGTINFTGVGATRDVVFRRNRIEDSIATQFALWITATAATTGQRIVTDNVFPTSTHVGTAAGKELIFAGSTGGFTVTGNVLHRVRISAITEYTPFTAFRGNLFATRGTGQANNISIGVGHPGDVVLNNYIFADSNTGDAAGITTPSTTPTTTGVVTYDGTIYDNTVPNEDADFGHYGDPGNTVTLRWVRNIALPNSRGRTSGNINGHGNKFTSIELIHNTMMTSDNTSPSVTGLVGFWTGSGYIGHANMYARLDDNLVWAKAVRATGVGNLITHTRNSGGPFTGTATAGGASTLTDGSKTFPTAAKVSLGDAGAIVVITARAGSGPPVGEVRTISSNTATQITVSTPFSATPDTGTGYTIFAKDVLQQASVRKNALYNGGTGTVYDATGGNATVLTGYDGFWQTSYATLGGTDVNLGTGTDESLSGPQFVDPSRNLPTFDTAYLGNAASATWDSHAAGDAFAVGDIKSNTDASFYAGALINYRCISAHTKSTANSEPGVGSGWRTYWELASVYRIREAQLAGLTRTDAALGLSGANYITTLWTWVRAGFAPRNALLRGAASDGGDIGAVPSVSAASISSINPSSGVQGTAPAVTITGSGTSFSGSSVVTISGSGVTASGTAAGSATSLSTTFAISAGATPGARTVTVTTGAEVVTTTFTVTAAPASISSINPSSGVQGTAPAVTITGSGTSFSGASAVSVSGSGVVVSGILAGSATSLTAVFTIAAGAATGARTVTVTTGGEVVTTTFTVTAEAPVTPEASASGSEGLASFDESGSFIYEELISGEPITVSAVIAGSQGVLLRGQVVGRNAVSGKWGKIETPKGILVHDVDTTGGDITGVIHVQGKYKDNVVIITGTGLTLPEVRAALHDSGVYLEDVQE